VILGAGAVGSAYGAVLSRENNLLLVGRENHTNAINNKGLTVEGDFAGIYSPAAAVRLEEIPPETLLIVATKAYDLAASLTAIQSLLRDDTTILLLQNGLGIEEVARQVVKKQCAIVRGLVTLASEMLSPGHIKVWCGKTILGPDQVSQKISQLLEKSGMPTRISSIFTNEIWKKCIINCVINPLTTILLVPNNEIGASELAWIRQSIVMESVEVATAEGVEFETDLVKLVEDLIPRYTNFSSMYQDIQRGRPTEIEFINGRIVELGKQHGLTTPINKCITQLVRFLSVSEGRRN
jgi:2-dehydropantoate 2-reductase